MTTYHFGIKVLNSMFTAIFTDQFSKGTAWRWKVGDLADFAISDECFPDSQAAYTWLGKKLNMTTHEVHECHVLAVAFPVELREHYGKAHWHDFRAAIAKSEGVLDYLDNLGG